MTNDKKSKTSNARYNATDAKSVTIASHDLLTPKDEANVNNVRNELQNVIDAMGSNSPLSFPNGSNDADNEESVCSTFDSTTQNKQTINDISIHESLMTVYNVPDFDNCKAQTTEAAVQTAADLNPVFICPHALNYQQNSRPCNPYRNNEFSNFQFFNERRSKLANWLGIGCRNEHKECSKNCEYYKINIQNVADEQSPPKVSNL